MKKQTTRTDQIYLLINFLIDFYIIDIFITTDEKSKYYANLIIKHEALEQFDIEDITEVELLFIKKQVVGLYV